MNPYDTLRNLMGGSSGAGLRPAIPRPDGALRRPEFRSPIRQMGPGSPQYDFPTKPCPTCGGSGVVPNVEAMMGLMGMEGIK